MQRTIYIAGGCFWGVQAYFDRVKGVISTEAGYCNGNSAFPRYEDLRSGKATHAETVKIVYDDSVISLDKLLELFLRFVDPYAIDKQGGDIGHQYRSGVYYVDLLDGVQVEAYFRDHLKPGWKIEIRQMNNFYPAEEYHQEYLAKHPDGYCHINLSSLKPDEKKTNH